MADRHLEPNTSELRARWGSFAWNKENVAKAKEVIAITITEICEGRD